MKQLFKVFSKTDGSESSSKLLSLDCGHFKTRVFRGKQLVFNQPSFFLTDNHSQAVLSLGGKAWQMTGKNPPGTKLRHILKSGSLYDLEQAEIFYKALWNQLQLSPVLPFLQQFQVKLALPNQASELDKKLWTQVLAEVGIRKASFVSKGEALLHSLPLEQREECNLLLLDIGAELTEVSLCVGGAVDPVATIELGSEKLTKKIKELLLSEFELKISTQNARLIKHQISANWLQFNPDSTAGSDGQVGRKLNIRGVQATRSLVTTQTIAEEALSSLIYQWAQELLSRLKIVFSRLDAEALVEVLANGCFLSGGGSLLSGFDEFLADELKTEVTQATDPFLATAQGLVQVAS